MSILAKKSNGFLVRIAVAPLAGAWIEICFPPPASSAPPVAPLAGAWIEIEDSPPSRYQIYVAPLAGAWIEMPCLLACYIQYLSLPSRERGLKFCLAE